MTYRTLSSHQHEIAKGERARLDAFKKRHRGGLEPVNISELERLAKSFLAERREILPPDIAAAIKQAVAEHEGGKPSPARRHLSLAESRRRGIDLDKLKACQNHFYRAATDLYGRRHSFSPASLLVDPSNWPLTILPPDIGGTTVYVPPFGEVWERWVVGEADGSGHVNTNESCIEAEYGITGALLAVRNHDAGDWDHLIAQRNNGFFIPFTPATTGAIQISAQLICLLCRHYISTDDEWGWSDFSCETTSDLTISVYWNHDDGEAVSENTKLSIAMGLNVRGDGESSPGTVAAAGPGDRKTVNFYPDIAFAAGRTVWIYVGVDNYIFAVLNDVSIDASVDSRWQLASLAVTSLE
jgi:hypothetical protein